MMLGGTSTLETLQDRCEMLEVQTLSPVPKSSCGNSSCFYLKGKTSFSLLLCLTLSKVSASFLKNS